MMDPALRRRMKELEIRSLRLVNSRFMGEWASNMRGQGLEFRDLREYVPGDDVRRLDWKATARSGHPQLRRYNEDRQQNIYLAVDLSASMAGRKAELALQMAAVLGWAAVKQGDRFGLAGFTDTVEIHRPPARGEAQLWATLEDLLQYAPASKQTNFGPLWKFFLKHLAHRATIIILSDFASGVDAHMLGALAMKHEILAFQISDPREEGIFSSGGAGSRSSIRKPASSPGSIFQRPKASGNSVMRWKPTGCESAPPSGKPVSGTIPFPWTRTFFLL
jgi:uncharacterized protein (DUF58 family)